MRSRPAIAVAFLLGALGFLAIARADSAFDVKLDVKERVLENGMRVLVAPRKGAPRVACALWFRVGSLDEEPGKTGLAHVLEHMFFKGSHRIGVKDAALSDKLVEQLDAAWERKRALEEQPDTAEAKKELSDAEKTWKDLIEAERKNDKREE